MLPELLTFTEAADRLKVPVDSLRKVSDEHGMTIMIGRAARISLEDIPELLKQCRVRRKAPALSGENPRTEPRTGRSGTDRPTSQQGLRISEKLKKL